MPDRESVVIVGTGHGGVQAADALRRSGWRGTVTLVGAEHHVPYQRPPLSKHVLDGTAADAGLLFHEPDHYAEQDIDLVLGDPATRVDRSGHQLQLGSGRRLGYDHLVLATGSRARRLKGVDDGLDGILTLRSLDQARDLGGRLRPGASVVMIGGGFIGLEVATAAGAVGAAVTVVDPVPRLLEGVLTPITAHFLAERHAAAGVRFRFGESLDRVVSADGRVAAVVTTSGTRIAADLVLLGVGSQPETTLAEDAGLAVEDGVLTDADLVTSDPAISAIGDCARYPVGGTSTRLSSVQHAFDSATHVARRLAGRGSGPYQPVPWFWTDQAGVKVQMAGMPPRGRLEELEVEGDVAGGRFAVHRYAGGRFVGGEAVGLPKAHLAMRRRLAAEKAMIPVG